SRPTHIRSSTSWAPTGASASGRPCVGWFGQSAGPDEGILPAGNPVSVATAPPPARAGEQAPPTAVESPGPRRGGVIGLLLGAGVLAIGFTEFRPVLGGLGNLSDMLFLAAFALSAAWWFLTVDQRQLATLRDGLGEIQPLLWGGIA